MEARKQFHYRILLVDGEHDLKASSALLRKHGYHVLTANDGFEALCGLRGSPPDMLIAELNLPRLSGFELLSIVRTRFPAIAVIAISRDYTPTTMPHETICDTFIAKDPNFEFELLEETKRLISESPIRGSRPKADVAPLWVPRQGTGYIVITCPECLRSFSVLEPKKSGIQHEACVCCGVNVPYELSSVEVPPNAAPEGLIDRSRRVREKSLRLVNDAQKLRRNPCF